MSATVQGIHGPVVLSPTGTGALCVVMDNDLRGAYTDPAAIHPATRSKLVHAGLIRLSDPNAAAIDEAYEITDAGRIAAAQIAGRPS